MALIRPRLNDHFDLPFTQEEADFAIPFLDEDIPLYVDPFLLWKSPSLQDNSLHTAVVNSFNYLGHLVNKDREGEAADILIRASECKEIGLGVSKKRQGTPIGRATAISILSLFRNIPQIKAAGFTHFEEIQLLVDNIARDRISDIACSYLKSFLLDYTIQQCDKHKVPLTKVRLPDIYDYRKHVFTSEENIHLPVNPETKAPILLVPRRWLRVLPWINLEDYVRNYYAVEIKVLDPSTVQRVELLAYNRHNYGVVQTYTARRERAQSDCSNDPLFRPIPVFSAKRKFDDIKKLPTGKSENADRQYEDYVCQLLASLLYPHLDFAAEQSRTDSGTLIRDLIFYNNRSLDFLQDVHRDYGSRQIVMELKNVREIDREHVNQLNRYLNDHFGRFGVLVTRNPLPRNILKNTIDLWSGQRRCIIALTDTDLALMVSVFESKQRLPIEVLKRQYLDFLRACPA